MATEILTDETLGARLNQMLGSSLRFLENVYALMRFLEAEVAKRDWELIKNGGYAVTRNGLGSGLASFATADWFPKHIGIGFVPLGRSKAYQGVTNTEIGDGLDILFFQVRWLDKSQAEPTVWYGKLSIARDPLTAKKAKKWEEYQSQAFRRIEAGKLGGEGQTSRIIEFKMDSGGSVSVSGEYQAVPITELLNEHDVVSKLIEPALALVS